jgi:hypothetical protein
MAVHTWNKTYSFKQGYQKPRSKDDPTPLITKVTVTINAVDAADATQTISIDETRSLDYYHLQSQDLPESFIPVNDITEQKMIDWFLAGTSNEDLDGFLTWQHYGWQEVSPYNEDNPAP